MTLFVPNVVLQPDQHCLEAFERRRGPRSEKVGIRLMLHQVRVRRAPVVPVYLFVATVDGVRRPAVQLHAEAWAEPTALALRPPSSVYEYQGAERAFIDTRLLLVAMPGSLRSVRNIEAEIRANRGFVTIERALATLASLQFPAVRATAVLGDCLISLLGSMLKLGPQAQIGYLAACFSCRDGLHPSRRVVEVGGAMFEFEVQIGAIQD